MLSFFNLVSTSFAVLLNSLSDKLSLNSGIALFFSFAKDSTTKASSFSSLALQRTRLFSFMLYVPSFIFSILTLERADAFWLAPCILAPAIIIPKFMSPFCSRDSFRERSDVNLSKSTSAVVSVVVPATRVNLWEEIIDLKKLGFLERTF